MGHAKILHVPRHRICCLWNTGKAQGCCPTDRHCSPLFSTPTPHFVLGAKSTCTLCPQLFAVSLSRWLLMPLATAGLLAGCLRAGLVPRDPALLFVLMMEVSGCTMIAMLSVHVDAVGMCVLCVLCGPKLTKASATAGLLAGCLRAGLVPRDPALLFVLMMEVSWCMCLLLRFWTCIRVLGRSVCFSCGQCAPDRFVQYAV